ncbi:MAG TPA: phage tail tube protein [Solimonas sp.]
MAQPNLEQFKKRGVAIKIETTAGTDAVPTSAANGVMLFNGSSGTEIDKIERPVDRPFLGGNPFVVGGKRAFIEGEFELYPPATPGGAATSSADCEVLLLPAGMTAVKDNVAKTTKYNPVSANIATASAYWYHAGTHKKVLGARNDLSNLSISVGERFKGNIRIQGDYDTVTEAALPSITLPSTVPTTAKASNTATNIQVGGGSDVLVWAKSLTVNLSNRIANKEYTSHKETGITERSPTFTLRIAKTALADFNPWAARDSAEVFAARLRLTEEDGRYSELGIRGQIEGINEVDIDGDYGWELTGPCVPSDAGGDEFYVLFGGVV